MAAGLAPLGTGEIEPRRAMEGDRGLAYNLIRTAMAQAAAGVGGAPRSISFMATLRVLEAFQPLIACRPAAARGTWRRCTSSYFGRSLFTGSPAGPTGSSPA